jgi:DNA-binding transcriptional regulator YhcF (GntR family)
LKAKDNIQKNYGELLKENIVFINGKKGFEVNTIDKEQKMEIEDLIETSILGDFISEKSDKFLFAKEFSEKLSNGEISIDSNTENNFINLFKTLKLI